MSRATDRRSVAGNEGYAEANPTRVPATGLAAEIGGVWPVDGGEAEPRTSAEADEHLIRGACHRTCQRVDLVLQVRVDRFRVDSLRFDRLCADSLQRLDRRAGPGHPPYLHEQEQHGGH